MSRPIKRLVALSVPLLAAAALAACGDDDKPGYCDSLGDLQESVGDFSVSEGGLTGVRSQLETIESQTRTLVADVSAEFSDEADAIESSLTTLKTAIAELPTPPTAESLAGLRPAANDVANAVRNFADATTSSC